MICEKDTCGGHLTIYKTIKLYRLNRRRQYAKCERCGQTYLLETKVIKMIRPAKSNAKI